MSPGQKRFQKTLWWILGVGWIVALAIFATLFVILR
jgi:hypothetical protein